MEIWKKVKDFPKYSASNKGRVRNDKTGRILTPTPAYSGYHKVTLFNDDGRFQMLLHRVVAVTFIPNPNNCPFVNHKDENKINNRVDNLEWCTPSYNTKYGTSVERTRENNPNCIKLIIDGKYFPSRAMAARYIGCKATTISEKLSKGITNYKGHTMQYV